MKTAKVLLFGSVLAGILWLAGCGSGVSGTYGGDECLYDKIEFKGGDAAYITFFGIENAGTYRTDGDRVIVTALSGESIVFTKNGGNLEAGILGERMVCERI